MQMTLISMLWTWRGATEAFGDPYAMSHGLFGMYEESLLNIRNWMRIWEKCPTFTKETYLVFKYAPKSMHTTHTYSYHGF